MQKKGTKKKEQSKRKKAYKRKTTILELNDQKSELKDTEKTDMMTP